MTGFDNALNWVQVADEAKGPRISDVDIDICVSQYLRRNTDAENRLAYKVGLSKDRLPLLMLDQVSKCFDYCCFQDRWNHDVVCVAKIKDINHHLHEFLSCL